MNPTPDTGQTPIQAEAEAIIGSGILGRSEAFNRLLRYLANKAASGRPVKEIEIAIDVFGRDESFDVTQDSLVRVYIHKLRTRLDRYYENRGEPNTRLYLPKGSYILCLGNPQDQDPSPGDTAAATRSVKTLIAPVIGLMVLLALVLWPRDQDHPAALIEHPLWSPLLQDGRPLTLVLGEVFVFSEINAEFEQTREIRDFSVHSAQQFRQLQSSQPQLMARFRDFGVRYLPGAIGNAMNGLTQLVSGHLNWSSLSSSALDRQEAPGNLLYIGHFTGLQTLHEVVMGASGYRLHPNGAVLIDKDTGEVFAGQGQLAEGFHDRYVDYALFVRRQRDDGTWIYALMSPRDIGLATLADFVFSADGLAEIEPGEVSGSPDIELLLEISGNRADSLSSRVRMVRSTDAR